MRFKQLFTQHIEKTLGAIKAEHTVKRITLNLSEANPGETLHVHVPKLNSNQVIMPGSLELRFSFVLASGNANNLLVQNISRALVDKFTVKYAGTTLQDTSGYDIYKCFEDLFLPQHVSCNNMLLEGIQTAKLCKIRLDADDKDTTGVDAEKALFLAPTTASG